MNVHGWLLTIDRLLLTEEGERKYAQSKPRYGSKQDEHFTQDGESASIQNPIAKFLFWLAFIGAYQSMPIVAVLRSDP